LRPLTRDLEVHVPFVRSTPIAATRKSWGPSQSVPHQLRATDRVPLQAPAHRHPRPVPWLSQAAELESFLAPTTAARFLPELRSKASWSPRWSTPLGSCASSARSKPSGGHNLIADASKSSFRTRTRRHLRTNR
jgi:hypothetical protein